MQTNDDYSNVLNIKTPSFNSSRYLCQTFGVGYCTLIDKQSGFCFIGSKALLHGYAYEKQDVLFASDNCYVINIGDGKTYKIKQNNCLSSNYFLNNGFINFNSLLEESSDIQYEGNIKQDIDLLLSVKPANPDIQHIGPAAGSALPMYPQYIYGKFKVKNIAQNNNNFISNNNFQNNFNNNNMNYNNNFMPNNSETLTIEKLYQKFGVNPNTSGSPGSDKGQFMNNCLEVCNKFNQMYSVSNDEEKKFLDLLKQDMDFFEKIYDSGDNNLNYFESLEKRLPFFSLARYS